MGYDDGGALVFNGDERAYLGEPGSSYEYWVAVPPHVGEIMARGARTWLDDHGIERGFRSY
ncbi:MAG TPA: hypothetical protein VF926_15145 [Mycobacterium sp.]